MKAQELLSPEDAVSFALSKNFDIILAKNEADISKINNNKATAGMLPTINVTTGDVFNLSNINQKFTTGQDVKKNWVPINNFNIGLNMNWTIFDGMKMFATKDKLAALQALGELQLKNAIKESSKISEERVSLSQKKLDVGYSDKTPLLQAKVDYSSQQLNILKQETVLEQAKVSLNNLLGRDANRLFEVIDTIIVDYQPNLISIKDTALIVNFSIQSALKNIEIAKFQHKEIKSQRLPQINFNSSYTFSQNNSKAGLMLLNRSYGPSVGLNATIPIFSGGKVKKQLESSAVNIASQHVQLNVLKNKMDAQILTAYKNFEYAQKIRKLNEQMLEDASENVRLSLERFRLNQTTSVEVKQAQGSYEDALYNVVLSNYTAKQAEIELRRLCNELVK